MKSNKNVKIKLSLVFLFLFSGIVVNIQIGHITNLKNRDRADKTNVELSGYWDLTGTPIFIDNMDPNYNWSRIANQYPWCSGSGTWNDPYIIENVTIDGQYSSSCITIQNSSAFFIIRNCTLSRGGWDYDGGIKLDNVSNSLLIYNYFTQNQLAGVLLLKNCANNTIMNNRWYVDDQNCIRFFKNCSNNRILNNKMIDSGGDNILLYENNDNNVIHGNYFTGVGNTMASGAAILLNNYCDKNIISNNNLSFNYNGGIRLDNYCDENVIKNNIIIDNFESYGILFIQYCDNNTIFNNTIRENGFFSFTDGHGIYFVENCDHNNITQNIITDNDYYGLYLRLGSDNNTIAENNLGNSISSDQETGIFLEDSSDNFITSNRFLNNTWRGIDINANSNDTQIHLNFFLNSGTENARDLGGNNNWNSSIIGNFWDTYVGVDDDQDGIGDTPYNFGTGTDYLPIYDDDAPNITIIEPTINQVCGVNAPNFIIEVTEPYIDTMWYSVNYGQNITFKDNSTVDQIIWGSLIDGIYDITFYANDTFKHMASQSIFVIKDTLAPAINIISPLTGSIINTTSLNFIVEIFDDHLDKMWYTIDSGPTKHFFTSNGTIQEWANLPNGPVTITFYANDTVGNVYSLYTTVIKQIPEDGNGNGGDIPGFHLYLIFGTILMSTCALMIFTFKKKKFKNI